MLCATTDLVTRATIQLNAAIPGTAGPAATIRCMPRVLACQMLLLKKEISLACCVASYTHFQVDAHVSCCMYLVAQRLTRHKTHYYECMCLFLFYTIPLSLSHWGSTPWCHQALQLVVHPSCRRTVDVKVVCASSLNCQWQCASACTSPELLKAYDTCLKSNLTSKTGRLPVLQQAGQQRQQTSPLPPATAQSESRLPLTSHQCSTIPPCVITAGGCTAQSVP